MARRAQTETPVSIKISLPRGIKVIETTTHADEYDPTDFRFWGRPPATHETLMELSPAAAWDLAFKLQKEALKAESK